MTHFRNIEYLHLFNVINHIDLNKIKDLYSNLKGLKLNAGNALLNISLINTFGNNLDFLSFHHWNRSRDYNLQNTDFVMILND